MSVMPSSFFISLRAYFNLFHVHFQYYFQVGFCLSEVRITSYLKGEQVEIGQKET